MTRNPGWIILCIIFACAVAWFAIDDKWKRNQDANLHLDPQLTFATNVEMRVHKAGGMIVQAAQPLPPVELPSAREVGKDYFQSGLRTGFAIAKAGGTFEDVEACDQAMRRNDIDFITKWFDSHFHGK